MHTHQLDKTCSQLGWQSSDQILDARQVVVRHRLRTTDYMTGRQVHSAEGCPCRGTGHQGARRLVSLRDGVSPHRSSGAAFDALVLALHRLVSALHVGTLIRAVHIIPVPQEISHSFIEFRNAATITVHDDTQALGHAPNWQVRIK